MAPCLCRIPGASSRLRSLVGRPGGFRARLRLKDLKRPRQNRFIARGALSIDAIEKELTQDYDALFHASAARLNLPPAAF